MTQMNAAQQLQTADNLAELWAGLLPDYRLPSRSQFLTWAAMCSEEVATYALNRAARKAHKQQEAGAPLDADALGRYLTGIMRNERDGRHEFPERRALDYKRNDA